MKRAKQVKEIAQLGLEGTGAAPVQLAIGEISEQGRNMAAGAVRHVPQDWQERSRLVDTNTYEEGLYAPAIWRDRHTLRAAIASRTPTAEDIDNSVYEEEPYATE